MSCILKHKEAINNLREDIDNVIVNRLPIFKEEVSSDLYNQAFYANLKPIAAVIENWNASLDALGIPGIVAEIKIYADTENTYTDGKPRLNYEIDYNIDVLDQIDQLRKSYGIYENKQSLNDYLKEEDYIIGETPEESMYDKEVPIEEGTFDESKIVYTDEEGNICAEFGYSSGLTTGGKWEVLTNFKGKSHAKGGIDIEIGDSGISMSRNKGSFKAASGLLVNEVDETPSAIAATPMINAEVPVNEGNPIPNIEDTTESPEIAPPQQDPVKKGKELNKDTKIAGFGDMYKSDQKVVRGVSKAPTYGREEVIGYLKTKFKEEGFSDYQVAGILGNIEHESQFDSDSINSDKSTYGLVQFRGTRKRDYFALADSRGVFPNDYKLQTEQILKELNSTHRQAKNAILKSKNYEEAADAWGELFEVYDLNDGSASKRREYAKKYLNG